MTITLKTLPKASAQEVFDHVVNHLLTQGERSQEEGKCVYLNPHGLRCAAGCLIAPEEYRKEFEGILWNALVMPSGEVPDTHYGLIRALQVIHDSYLVTEWKPNLKLVADEF